jgi:hypothetical protein
MIDFQSVFCVGKANSPDPGGKPKADRSKPKTNYHCPNGSLKFRASLELGGWNLDVPAFSAFISAYASESVS